MKQVPKFLITHNKYAKSSDAVYLVHTQAPSFVAQVKEFDSKESCDLAIQLEDSTVFPVTPTCYAVILEYLTSEDLDKGKAFLRKRVPAWIRENILKMR